MNGRSNGGASFAADVMASPLLASGLLTFEELDSDMVEIVGADKAWPPADPDEISEARLAEALPQTPQGAFALAGLTVAGLLIAWFLIYLFVFIPRGVVG